MTDVATTNDMRVVEFLAAGKNSAVVDPEQAQLEIIRRILASDSIADVLEQQEAIHAKDVLDERIRIVGFRYMESDLKETGPAFYMLIDCVNDDGEPYSVTCGAVNVMAQLHRLGQLDALPMVGRIIETEKKTKAGYTPMWLHGDSDSTSPTFNPLAKAKDF